MTAQELAAKPAKEVRSSNELMELYIEEYTALFGKAPNCVSCTFKNDYLRFQQAIKQEVKPQKTTTMKTTFKLKQKYQDKILRYKKDGAINRKYGRKMDDTFAREFLSNGTKEELEERKEMFYTLPEENSDEVEDTVNPTVKPPKKDEDISDEDMTLAELREKYPDIKARSKEDFLEKLNE